MSIEFNRRTFLKTGAALIGATALVGLTGCDSSSSSSAPSVNKKVNTATDSFKFGSTLKIEPLGTYSYDDTGAGPSLTITNLTSSDITFYPDSFSASYKGNALRLVKVDIASGNTESVTIKAGKSYTVEPRFAVPSGVSVTAVIDDVVFKFHYSDKSIKFQTKSKGEELYTSGVYTDKVKA